MYWICDGINFTYYLFVDITFDCSDHWNSCSQICSCLLTWNYSVNKYPLYYFVYCWSSQLTKMVKQRYYVLKKYHIILSYALYSWCYVSSCFFRGKHEKCNLVYESFSSSLWKNNFFWKVKIITFVIHNLLANSNKRYQ